ncbi:pimeloyl-ACP methyl ester carboxylesterase [Nocardia sp. GAS34]|uniref:alpha/beta hydrolase n=1 Tax=unclassified Nocardia TaxID=2637762 RepID=UPI003D1BBFAF
MSTEHQHWVTHYEKQAARRLAERSESMRFSHFVLAAVISLLALAIPAVPRAAAAPGDGIVDREISFSVRNVNASGVPCGTDGRSYTVHGHLTGPARALAGHTAAGAALYLHGLEVGEWFWRFGAVPGYNHVREMTARGHVSVTIDRLGYGASGQPAGTLSCVGGQATVAHQIVQELRSGDYSADGGVVAFEHVALLGHSLGGAITQIEAYSFGDVDAVGVLSYSDLALTPELLAGTLSWGTTCLTGGRKSPAGASGYSYLTPSVDAYRQDFLAQSPPAVLAAALPLRAINPCGDMVSLTEATAIDPLRLGAIHVPVLTLTGTNDRVFDVNRARYQGKLFTGSTDVTSDILDGATHGLTVEPTAAQFRNDLDSWLGAHGF